MADGGRLEADMLFLGLTRPAMFLGVSSSVVALNFLINMFIFVLTSNFLFPLIVMPILHGAGYVLTQKEPLFVDLFMVKQQKCNRCKNRFFHGLTNSYDIM